MKILKMDSVLQSERGVSLLVSALVVVAIGLTGLGVVNNSAKNATSTVSDLNAKEAENLANGGLEAALLKLDQGQNPTQTYSLDANNEGTVFITANPDARTVTVLGVAENGVNDAKKTYTINAKFSGDDIALNSEHTSFSGNQLQGLYFEKTGSRTNILDKIRVTWNQSYCARLTTCPNPEAVIPSNGNGELGCWSAPASWTPYEDPSNQNKVLICHTPPGNPENKNTISVNKNAVATHYCHHDDSLGACTVAAATPVYVTCEENDLSEAQMDTLENYCSKTSGGAKVDRVVMTGATTVFLDGSIPNAEAKSQHSGEDIDIADVTMTTPGNYTIDSIRFNHDVTDATWFTVEGIFLDGSTTAQTFQVRTYNIDTNSLQAQQNDVQYGEDFTTEDASGEKTGEVTVFANDNYVFMAKVLGSQMTCGQNGPAAAVTARVRINGTFYNAFDGQAVVAGDLYTKDNLMVENDYAVEATASMPACNNYLKTVLSTTTSLVKFLVNGDTPPSTLSGFGGQQPVSAMLSAYISANGLIQLPSNQVIALFELGNDIGSPNADFQDLVLLITITKQ